MIPSQSTDRSFTAGVAALVVTFQPDRGITNRLELLLKQLERLVIVDNGTSPGAMEWSTRYRDTGKGSIIVNRTNLGIATALNQGMQLLRDEGYEWALTLDQDSVVQPGFVASLLKSLSSDSDPERVALIGANRRDIGTDGSHRWLRSSRKFPFFERVQCDAINSDGVSLVITSGTLTNIKTFMKLGPFRDDYFIDYVDFEYCLRARKEGYKLLVSCDAMLGHQVGEKEQRKVAGVTLSPTFHSPLRRYYLFRNRVDMIRLYGRIFPHWLLYDLAAMLHILAVIVLFED